MKINRLMAKMNGQDGEGNLVKVKDQQIMKNYIPRLETLNEDFDLTEIREFEEISTQRKEKINYDYLKEKILIEASVRKIQRAWRNYRTRKLVTSYSSTISAKFMKNQLINTSRS